MKKHQIGLWLALSLFLTGCGLWGQQDVLKNRRYEYRDAQNYNPLTLPEDLQLTGAVPYAPIPPARSDKALSIPEIEALLTPPQLNLTATDEPSPEPTEVVSTENVAPTTTDSDTAAAAEDRIADALGQ